MIGRNTDYFTVYDLETQSEELVNLVTNKLFKFKF